MIGPTPPDGLKVESGTPASRGQAAIGPLDYLPGVSWREVERRRRLRRLWLMCQWWWPGWPEARRER